MEKLVRIAPVTACQRGIGERSFNVHHGLGMSIRQRGRLTQQLQSVVHVLQIPLAAGVLQPPLYDSKLDDAPSYGNMGQPDPDRICTSIVERSNRSVTMGIRRFTRLTSGFR